MWALGRVSSPQITEALYRILQTWHLWHDHSLYEQAETAQWVQLPDIREDLEWPRYPCTGCGGRGGKSLQSQHLGGGGRAFRRPSSFCTAWGVGGQPGLQKTLPQSKTTSWHLAELRPTHTLSWPLLQCELDWGGGGDNGSQLPLRSKELNSKFGDVYLINRTKPWEAAAQCPHLLHCLPTFYYTLLNEPRLRHPTSCSCKHRDPQSELNLRDLSPHYLNRLQSNLRT